MPSCTLLRTPACVLTRIIETIRFQIFATALQAAGLVSDSGEGSYTVFTPNDTAFEKLPSERLNKLLDPVWKPQVSVNWNSLIGILIQ